MSSDWIPHVLGFCCALFFKASRLGFKGLLFLVMYHGLLPDEYGFVSSDTFSKLCMACIASLVSSLYCIMKQDWSESHES